jgi:hypothetical protein
MKQARTWQDLDRIQSGSLQEQMRGLNKLEHLTGSRKYKMLRITDRIKKLEPLKRSRQDKDQ